jgi:dihydroneopterin aldolase
MTVTQIFSRSDLDAAYIERVNQAVAEERFDLVDNLAREYARELTRFQSAA